MNLTLNTEKIIRLKIKSGQKDILNLTANSRIKWICSKFYIVAAMWMTY